MFETETEKENTQDWRYSRRKPEYNELNKILARARGMKIDIKFYPAI